MPRDATVTPKGTLLVKDLSSGLSDGNLSGAGLATFKVKRGNLLASLAVTDATIKNVKTLKDVVLTADYRVSRIRGTVLNSKLDLGTKKYQLGATWDGILARRTSTVKLWWSNKDNKVAGEATVGVTRDQKANVTFNQNKLITAKYTVQRGAYTYEPSYNFDRQATAAAVTKRLNLKETLKLSYDLKSEVAAIEFAHKPMKITLGTTINNKLAVGKPSLTAVFENTYSF